MSVQQKNISGKRESSWEALSSQEFILRMTFGYCKFIALLVLGQMKWCNIMCHFTVAMGIKKTLKLIFSPICKVTGVWNFIYTWHGLPSSCPRCFHLYPSILIFFQEDVWEVHAVRFSKNPFEVPVRVILESYLLWSIHRRSYYTYFCSYKSFHLCVLIFVL